MPVPFAWLAPHVPEGGWSNVIWAGVGYGDDLEILQAQGAGGFLYLEPNPALAGLLESSSRLGAGAMLLRQAIWHESGEMALHVLNDPLHSALGPSERLLSACRKLRVTGEPLVRTTTLDTLCATLGEDAERLLVLDACGSESSVIASASEPALASFACILVRHDALHGETTSLDAVRDRLDTCGFERAVEDRDAEGTWLLFVRSRAAESEHGTASMEASQSLQVDAQRLAELEAVSAQAEQDAARIAQLERQLEQASQTVRMAVKLQSQREADLEDLQARYRDGQQALERQRELLDKLGERLGVASQYFDQLSHAAGSGPHDVSAEPASRAAGAGDARAPGEPSRGTAKSKSRD